MLSTQKTLLRHYWNSHIQSWDLHSCLQLLLTKSFFNHTPPKYSNTHHWNIKIAPTPLTQNLMHLHSLLKPFHAHFWKCHTLMTHTILTFSTHIHYETNYLSAHVHDFLLSYTLPNTLTHWKVLIQYILHWQLKHTHEWQFSSNAQLNHSHKVLQHSCALMIYIFSVQVRYYKLCYHTDTLTVFFFFRTHKILKDSLGQEVLSFVRRREDVMSAMPTLPLLGEVTQVLLHSPIERIKAFDVQVVQHLRVQDAGEDAVIGQTLRACVHNIKTTL